MTKLVSYTIEESDFTVEFESEQEDVKFTVQEMPKYKFGKEFLYRFLNDFRIPTKDYSNSHFMWCRQCDDVQEFNPKNKCRICNSEYATNVKTQLMVCRGHFKNRYQCQNMVLCEQQYIGTTMQDCIECERKFQISYTQHTQNLLGDKIMNQGKYKGKSFKQIHTDHQDFCNVVINKDYKTHYMIKLKEYLQTFETLKQLV